MRDPYQIPTPAPSPIICFPGHAWIGEMADELAAIGSHLGSQVLLAHGIPAHGEDF